MRKDYSTNMRSQLKNIYNQLVNIALSKRGKSHGSNQVKLNFGVLAHITLFAVIFPCQVHSTVKYQSVDSILETARQFTLANLSQADQDQSVITGKIDKRLRLKACTDQLEAFFPEYGRRVGNITVGVRCNGEETWSLFVPISVKVFRNVVVLNKPLARGTIITEADLSIEQRNISAFSTDFFSDIDSLIGMELQRPIQIGQAISSLYVKKPIAVRRGNLVTLVAKNAIVEVRMEGKAMADGAVGHKVKVRNMRSKRIIEGIVKSSTIIEVY